jgi:signal transduction histidine kinase
VPSAFLSLDAPAPGRTEPRAGVVNWITCLVVLAVVWVAIGVGGFERQALRAEEREHVAASTAKGFAEYVGAHLLIADRLLVNTRESFLRTGGVPAHAQLVAEFGQMGPLLVQLAVADAQGRVVASSLPLAAGLSIGDRPHFTALRDDPRDRLHVGQPVVGRVSGRMSLQLVRPVLAPDGGFRGVIVASIDPLMLQQYFGSLDGFAGDGSVDIVGRADGVVRAHFTRASIGWGGSLRAHPAWQRIASLPSGSVAGRRATGDDRILGFHHVPNYPLAVVVGRRTPAWPLGEMALTIAIGALFSLFMLRHTRVQVRRLQEQGMALEQLRRSHARETEASRMKSNFLASISHELRTPLNAILGFSELIRDLPAHPSTPRYADLIHGAGRHLHALLDSLLDSAKIEAGRMQVERSEVDTGALLQRLVEVHRGSAARKQLSMDLAWLLPAGVRAVACTDVTKLTQVMNNVLHNAVKFTSQGGIRIEARLEGPVLHVAVRDSGRGIPPEQLPHVFDRFSNVKRAGLEDGAGTGLGLALSRDLMKLLGGGIGIESRPGEGTCVALWLPGIELEEALP